MALSRIKGVRREEKRLKERRRMKLDGAGMRKVQLDLMYKRERSVNPR